MRIISGEWGGRRLEGPRGKETRPMMDRVKESIFSVLAPWLPDARVLDLFAGTGCLGLEALSRGAARVRFCETGEEARGMLTRNIETLNAGESVDPLSGDALRSVSWGKERYDIIFLDPPFPMVRELNDRRIVLETLEKLAKDHLESDGVVVLHVPRHALRLSELSTLLVAREREYGGQSIWYVQLDDEQGEAEAEPESDDA